MRVLRLECYTCILSQITIEKHQQAWKIANVLHIYHLME